MRSTSERDEIIVTLQIAPGYHVNANPASFDYLIPTTLRLPGLPGARMQYPSGALLKAKFAPEGIRVYSDTVELVAQLAKGSLAHAAALRATVDAQACTDSVCLPPSQIPLTVRMGRLIISKMCDHGSRTHNSEHEVLATDNTGEET